LRRTTYTRPFAEEISVVLPPPKDPNFVLPPPTEEEYNRDISGDLWVEDADILDKFGDQFDDDDDLSLDDEDDEPEQG